MPEMMSETRKRMMREHPEINWTEEAEAGTSPAMKAQPKTQPRKQVSTAYGYGAMMRLLGSKENVEGELERFTDLSSEETRQKGKERAMGYLERVRRLGGK